MIVKLNDEAIAAIEAALRRGQRVEIQREKNGIKVFAFNRKIIYQESPKPRG